MAVSCACVSSHNFANHILTHTSYLREVGFPDNVLEARVSRISAYKNLYGQTQPLDQSMASMRSDSPKPSVSSEIILVVR